MGANLKQIPFLNHQLAGWLLWGIMLWLYMDKVVPGAFRGVGDWAIMMGIHVITANLAAFAIGPRLIIRFQERRYMQAVFLGILFLLGILLFALALSIALQAITVRTGALDQPRSGIVNKWQTLMVLFGGVAVGTVYGGALWVRQVLQLDKLQYDELEQRLQSALDERTFERLNGQLIPHLINNLMDTLSFAVKWRPEKVGYVAYAISQFTKTYGRLDTQSLMPLADELELLDLYIELIRIQLGYKPHIKIDAEVPSGSCGCIPMLLILLAENMKKYAVLSDSAHPAVIYIRVRDERLIVRASNRKRDAGAGFSTQTGLKNLTDRLRLLWGEDAHISISGMLATSDTFSVTICCHTGLFA